MTQQSLSDIVGLCIVLAALLFSAEVANVVGPYIVIAVGAVIGASFKLGRAEKTTRSGAVWFLVRSAGIAILLTGSAAAVVHHSYPGMHERFLLAPIAILLGWTDWPATLRRATSLIWAGVDTLRGKGGTP